MSAQWTERDRVSQLARRARKRAVEHARRERRLSVPSGSICVEPGCTRSTVWGFDESDPDHPEVILYDPISGLCKLHNDIAIYRRMRAYDRAG